MIQFNFEWKIYTQKHSSRFIAKQATENTEMKDSVNGNGKTEFSMETFLELENRKSTDRLHKFGSCLDFCRYEG